MVSLLTLLLMIHVLQADAGNESCNGESLKREFQTFTEGIEKSMNAFKKQMKADFERKGRINKSVVYTRWGKKTCPSNAEMVLSGFVGGSLSSHSGAAVDPLCLPRHPEWGRYKDGFDGDKAYVYLGAEYETRTSPSNLRIFHDHDVPCAVCLVHDRSVVRVFPARKTCYKGWELEYNGYLMAGRYNQSAATTYTCVDRKPDTISGGLSNHNGYLFYSVEVICGSSKCPPYVKGRELVCAV